MNKFVKHIAERIQTENPVFEQFFLDARKDEEGRVTIPIEINGNEKTFAGITDNNCPFFYIRWREDFLFYEEIPDDKRFSAGERFVEQRLPLRLVAVGDCFDPYSIEEGIRKSILSFIIFPEAGVRKGRAVLRQSLLDSMSVLKEEAKPKKFDKNLTFVLVDFDLIVEVNEVCQTDDCL